MHSDFQLGRESRHLKLLKSELIKADICMGNAVSVGQGRGMMSTEGLRGTANGLASFATPES